MLFFQNASFPTLIIEKFDAKIGEFSGFDILIVGEGEGGELQFALTNNIDSHIFPLALQPKTQPSI